MANKRERRYIAHNLDYCTEKDPSAFETPLARAILKSLQVLHVKLVSESERIAILGARRQ